MNADDYIQKTFPNLGRGAFKVTSDEDQLYNCIAWAVGTSTVWWWPDEGSFWPTGVPHHETVDVFVAAFATQQFVLCEDGQLEEGYEKIVLYAVAEVPKHASRQLPSGKWTSKLGMFKDIEHDDPDGLSGDAYGTPVKFMKRPVAVV